MNIFNRTDTLVVEKTVKQSHIYTIYNNCCLWISSSADTDLIVPGLIDTGKMLSFCCLFNN